MIYINQILDLFHRIMFHVKLYAPKLLFCMGVVTIYKCRPESLPPYLKENPAWFELTHELKPEHWFMLRLFKQSLLFCSVEEKKEQRQYPLLHKTMTSNPDSKWNILFVGIKKTVDINSQNVIIPVSINLRIFAYV